MSAKKASTKSDGKRTYVKRDLDDRIALQEAKLADLKLKKKVKDNPEAKKLAAQIRNLRKIPNPTKNILATIEELTERLK